MPYVTRLNVLAPASILRRVHRAVHGVVRSMRCQPEPAGAGALAGIARALVLVKLADERIERIEGAYQIAETHAWRGKRDQAFEWLEQSYG
jgi:hypothetical protein